MKVLFVGTGSIGKRHCINLMAIITDVKLCFLRANGQHDEFSQQVNAEIFNSIDKVPRDIDAVFLCAPSHIRKEIYQEVFDRNIPLYIEKPIASSLEDIAWLNSNIHKYSATSFVGFNLRFLPVVNEVKKLLHRLGNVCRASFEVGQYLPDWRTNTDYRKVYSSQKSMGGGVVLDLLHEVDLAYYLFGDFPSALVASNKFSNLEIDVDDTAAVLLNRNDGPLVTVNMDYVARKPIRCFKIVGDKATLFCDIFNKKLLIESQTSEEYLDLNKSFYDVNATYKHALKEFLSSISKKIPSAYPLREAIQMHQLILEQIQK